VRNALLDIIRTPLVNRRAVLVMLDPILIQKSNQNVLPVQLENTPTKPLVIIAMTVMWAISLMLRDRQAALPAAKGNLLILRVKLHAFLAR